MTTSTVDAVVLRRWDSAEADRRVSLLTKERGKVIAIARGARKARSKLAAITEPLMRSTVELAKGKQVEYIVQAQPTRSFPALRSDFTRLSVSLAWLEVVDAALHPGESHDEAFRLCVSVLEAIESAREPLAPLCWGDLQLLSLVGMTPELDVSAVSGREVRHGRAILCPRAGGTIAAGEAEEGWPAYVVSRETLIAMRKILEVDEPPAYLKGAGQVAKAIFPFWIEFLSHDLPARRRLFDSMPRNEDRLQSVLS